MYLGLHLYAVTMDTDDVKIRVGNHDDEVYRNRGPSDQPSGPNHKSSRSLFRSTSGTEDDDEANDDSTSDEGVAKPLMHPRKRLRSNETTPHAHKRCSHVVWPIVYLFLFIGGSAVFVWLVIYVLNAYNAGMMAARFGSRKTLVGCDHVTVDDVWILGLPKLMTESAIRMLDVNEDGQLDVVMGFATGKWTTTYFFHFYSNRSKQYYMCSR